MDVFQVVADVTCLEVQLAPPNYRLSLSALDASLEKAKAKGCRVRALILTSPHNPLGVIYTETELRACVGWCRQHGLHLISDEIYALSSEAQRKTHRPFGL